jgi:hypothetical protein
VLSKLLYKSTDFPDEILKNLAFIFTKNPAGKQDIV